MKGTINIDFSEQSPEYETIELTGDHAFVTSNLDSGRCKTLKISTGQTPCNITFPAGWVFINTPSITSIDPRKIFILVLYCFGKNNVDVRADGFISKIMEPNSTNKDR